MIFEIQHGPGMNHNNVEVLSSRPCGKCKHCERVDERQGRSPWNKAKDGLLTAENLMRVRFSKKDSDTGLLLK